MLRARRDMTEYSVGTSFELLSHNQFLGFRIKKKFFSFSR
jgi:hypothetical protein